LNSSQPYNCDLAPHQILTPFPDAFNSFVGAHVPPVADPPPSARANVGLIYAKNPRSIIANFTRNHDKTRSDMSMCVSEHGSCAQNSLGFGSGSPQSASLTRLSEGIPAGLSALVSSGVKLYTTLQDEDFQQLQDEGMIPTQGVVNYPGLDAKGFHRLLSTVSFVIGMGFPLSSPAPIEALMYGASFLNPVFPRPINIGQPASFGIAKSQHDPLMALADGPHVINIDFRRPETLVAAAATAANNRFSSYTPYELTQARVHKRVCDILEWNAWPTDATDTGASGKFNEAGPLELTMAMLRDVPR